MGLQLEHVQLRAAPTERRQPQVVADRHLPGDRGGQLHVPPAGLASPRADLGPVHRHPHGARHPARADPGGRDPRGHRPQGGQLRPAVRGHLPRRGLHLPGDGRAALLRNRIGRGLDDSDPPPAASPAAGRRGSRPDRAGLRADELRRRQRPAVLAAAGAGRQPAPALGHPRRDWLPPGAGAAVRAASPRLPPSRISAAGRRHRRRSADRRPARHPFQRRRRQARRPGARSGGRRTGPAPVPCRIRHHPHRALADLGGVRGALAADRSPHRRSALAAALPARPGSRLVLPALGALRRSARRVVPDRLPGRPPGCRHGTSEVPCRRGRRRPCRDPVRGAILHVTLLATAATQRPDLLGLGPDAIVAAWRAASLYLPIAVTALLWWHRRPASSERAGLVLAALWNVVALAALQAAARAAGWWRFGAHGGLLLGMPVDLYLGWVLLWGAIPLLAAPRLPWVATAAL